MTTLLDLPTDCINEIIKSFNIYTTPWFLSQCCKSLRKFRPIGLPINEFILKLLLTQSPDIIKYYINISNGTKDFWNDFINEAYILVYIGTNCDLEFIEWINTELPSPDHKSTIMEFAVLKMTKEQIDKYYTEFLNLKYTTTTSSTLAYDFCRISIDTRMSELGYTSTIKANLSNEITWCFRHAIISERSARLMKYIQVFVTNNEAEQFYIFRHRDLPSFLQQLQSKVNHIMANIVHLNTTKLDFEYGYHSMSMTYFKGIQGNNANLSILNDHAFKLIIGLKCAPFSKYEIDILIARLIKGDIVTDETAKNITNANFLPRYKELMVLLKLIKNTQ